MSFWPLHNFTSNNFTGEVQFVPEDVDSASSAASTSCDDDEEYIQNMQEQIVCLKAEYAFEMSKNSKLQSDMERQDVLHRRRMKILGYYDDYIFNVVLNDDDEFDVGRLEREIDAKDIESDYRNCIRIIQQEMQRSLQEEDERELEQIQESQHRAHRPKHEASMSMTSFVGNVGRITAHRPRSKSAAHIHRTFHLYRVSPENEALEKQWMRELRKARFRVFAAKHRHRRLRILKRESKNKLPELESQIAMKEKMERFNALKKQLDAIKESRIKYIQNIAAELHHIRSSLISMHSHSAQNRTTAV